MSRKPFERPVPVYSWWTLRPRYIRYMAREASSLFIGAYTGVIVAGLVQLARGAEAWNAFLDVLHAPLSIAFHLVALGFSLYHTITWFSVTPKAMPIWIGETRLPGGVIVGAHYFGWVVFSLLVLLLAGARS